MHRPKAVFSVLYIFLLFLPSVALADYQFTGSSGMQLFAVQEPATPDALFRSWTGRIQEAGPANFGASIDFLRNAEDSTDWDVILSATGSFRRGKNFLFGVSLPYIIRDPDFNESDLLDLRAFARMGLVDSPSGFGVSGELSTILPTAKSGTTAYPFSLDTPVVGVRLAFFGGKGDTKAGAGIGYQTYLQSESGDDADLIFNLWMEKLLEGPWSLVAEYAGSRHDHSGAPGDDSVTDGTLLVGLLRAHSSRTTLGVAMGTGMGEDKFADVLVTARATVRFGAVKEAKVKRKPVPKPAPEPPEREVTAPAPPPPAKKAPSPGAVTVVMMAEKVGTPEARRRVVLALRAKGYATGMDPDPGVKSTGQNILYYMPGMKEKAIEVANILALGGPLKEVRVRQSEVRIPANWLLLVLGGEK